MSSSPPEPTRDPKELLTKAMAIEEQYMQTWSLSDVELRITLIETALALDSGILHDHQAFQKREFFRNTATYMLAKALKDRYHHVESAADLDHQIALLQPLLTNLDNNPLRLPCLRLLGGAHRDRAVLNSSKDDIQEALTYHGFLRDLFEVSPDQPGWMLSEMGTTLRTYASEFAAAGDDLDISCALLTRSLDAHWEDDYDKSQAYFALSGALRARYFKTSDLVDIEGSVAAARQNAMVCHTGHRDRPRACQALGTTLIQLAMHTDNQAMLDEGVTILTEGVHSKKHPTLLASLAYALTIRFMALGSVIDLEQAIQHLREGLNICSPHASYRISLLTSYAVASNYQFEISQDLNALDEGILAHRECVSITPLDHIYRGSTVINLAGSLARHSAVYGKLESLEEALELLQEEYDRTNSNHPEYALRSNTLANMYSQRYLTKGNVHDAQKALFLIENGAGRVTDNNLSRSRLYGIAADNLYTLYSDEQFTEFATLDILETSLMYWQRALDSCPSESSWRAEYLSGLALTKTIRYRLLTQESDVNSALQHQKESLRLSQDSQPYNYINAACGMTLIHLLESSRHYDLDKALDYLETASKRLDTYALVRMEKITRVLQEFNCHCHLERLSSHQLTRLINAYQNLIDQIPCCAFIGLQSRGLLLMLRLTEVLASGAAQVAMLVHYPTRALELLEQGRATFWAQHIQLRTHMNSKDHSIFEELYNVARRLQAAAETSNTNYSPVAHVSELHSQSQRKLGLRFEELVVRARGVPGFEHFLLPKTFSWLAQAAGHHPVVVLLAGSFKCYGIILLPGQSSPISVELHDVTHEQLATMVSQLKMAKSRDRGAALRTHQRAMLVTRKKQDFCTVDKVLHELWTKVMKAVVKAAGLKQALDKERSRLHICCTGVFSHLPIHASGMFKGRQSTSLTEYAIVSYTPTITALITASQNLPKIRKEDAHILISTVYRGFQWTPLPCVEDEANMIAAVVPPNSILSVRGIQAKDSHRHSVSAKEVLEYLPHATILHMACHGYQDQANTLTSGFVMSDKMLTVEQLLELQLPKAQFAFLSACETAKTDEMQPDQAVNLASTLLFAGFKSVIGTMWSMNDVDGPLVARSVYEAMFGGSGEYLDLDSIPQALDTAIRTLRQNGVRATRWAPYVHIGA